MDRRRFLISSGVSATLFSTSGCVLSPTTDDVPGPDYPGGTLRIYNTAKSDLSVTVTTVDHSSRASLETTVPAGETEIHREFVTASAGTSVTLKARVETAESWTRFTFMPNGGGGESDAPPHYAFLHIIGSGGGVEWSAREATE